MTDVMETSAIGTTGSDSVSMPRIEQPTEVSPDVLASRAGALRSNTGLLSKDVAQIHHDTLQLQINSKTRSAEKQTPVELLNQLASKGFAWINVARVVGVSVPAVRKWRQGESASGENRHKLARIVAMVDVLEEDHLIQDVASWLDIPICEPCFTGIDVLEAGGYEDLIAYAGEHIGATALLDRWLPNWRDEVDDGLEIFVAGDGERAIRRRQD